MVLASNLLVGGPDEIRPEEQVLSQVLRHCPQHFRAFSGEGGGRSVSRNGERMLRALLRDISNLH